MLVSIRVDSNLLLTVVAWLCTGLRSAVGLQCNQCYNADKVVDCQRATVTCQPGQSCFRDSTHITYESSDQKTLTVWMYKMGCTFTPICRDGVSYGPGPYGYSRIIRFCCCTDRCNAPDGTGKGIYKNCSSSVVNGTINAAVNHHTTTSTSPFSHIFTVIVICLYGQTIRLLTDIQ